MGETPSSELMCSGSVVRIASRLEKEHGILPFLEKSTAYHLRARSVPGSAEPLSFTNRYRVAQYVSGPLKHRPFRSMRGSRPFGCDPARHIQLSGPGPGDRDPIDLKRMVPARIPIRRLIRGGFSRPTLVI